MPDIYHIAGHQCPVVWVPVSTGAAATLKVRSHSWEEEIGRIIVTHTSSGGLAARLMTVLDGKGNVTAFLRVDQFPAASPQLIFAGSAGVLSFYFAGLTHEPFAAPCNVVKVNYQTAVEGGSEFNFDAEMNSEILNAYQRMDQ